MTRHVTIVGGGWAGLAAAVALSKHKIAITLYESARHLGGRARSVRMNNLTLDNGQHLMIGAYHQLLDLLDTMGVREDTVFHRIAQHFRLLDQMTGETCFEIRLPHLPYPFHLLGGMLTSPSLSFQQKLATLIRFNSLLKQELTQDISVDSWLEQSGLPQSYIDYMLKPLCLAALTTHSHEASACIFQNVLRQTFNAPSRYTDLLIPRTDLGNVFPQHAKAFIEKQGGKVVTGKKVNSLIATHDRIDAINTDDQVHEVDHLILATPPAITARLLSTQDQCHSLCQQLNGFSYEAVITVYLEYPVDTRLPLPMVGLINATAQWLFDRRYCQQAGMIAAVISASGAHDAMDNDSLAATIAEELRQIFKFPMPMSSHVIREKRATIRCITDIDQHRPGIQTPLHNLKLCGDYVHFEQYSIAGLPSTLEAAVRSGVKCAATLIQDIS